MKSFVTAALLLGVLVARAHAQAVPVALNPPVAANANANANANPDTPGASAHLLDDVRIQISQGRAQFESNQIASVETLRNAAQKSLAALVSYVGPQVLTAPPDQIPTTGFYAAAARQAAEAHYWWGRAADTFGRRDEALTAFARAARFAGQLRGGSNVLARDSLLALGGSLRDGLPLIAPDDTLDTIAQIAHGNLWQPRRFACDFSNLNLEIAPLSSNQDAAPRAPLTREFLLTSGRLYPPVPTSTVDVESALSRVPPLYRGVKEDALPEVLKLDRMAVGYERATDGANKGLWRQEVRVFYASTFLTKDRRDDRLRAEALCAQFLKARALFQIALGLQNPYAKDGVTTLWLSEVSSLWPRDDDDPQVREALGPQMPKVNIVMPGQSTPLQIDTPPTSFPWRAAAQMDSAPGEIMFFKMAAPRQEGEWLREIMHEYGHVSLPAFDGFKPPLEPYANGVLGETLGMLWAGSEPAAWSVPDEIKDTQNADSDATSTPAPAPTSASAIAPAGEDKVPATIGAHIQSQASAALKFWQGKGPASVLRRDASIAGWQYLQGLSVYIERVYGAPSLGRAFAPLAAKGAQAPNALERLHAVNTEWLMSTLPSALNEGLGTSIHGSAVVVTLSGGKTQALPIWLGGALEKSLNADDLISRAPAKLKSGERAAGWVYVPSAASTLRVEWQSASRDADALSIEGLKTSSAAPFHPDATGAFKLDVKARSGWQRFTFAAHSDVTILASQFEK